jgi:hypothetical protein
MGADVLLGSRFADLEAHGTRWRSVLVRWAADRRVTSLTTVDFPRFGRRAGVRETPSWLPGCRSLHVDVLGPVAGGTTDALGWALAGVGLRRHLGTSSHRVAVAANPLSTPLLGRLAAHRAGFDAVDDWRAFPSVARALPRVEAGYRAAHRAATVTTVSDVLSARLARDFGLAPLTVGNAVERRATSAAAPDGLPADPFAVYVGTVQDRVDLDLLGAVARRVPVVVAGPADAAHAAQLEALPLTWLGPIPVEQVPGLLARAAVGLLPHRRDSLTESMAPMKLLEYVASGLRTVSTSLPDVGRHPGVVVVDDHEAFVAAVVSALGGGRLLVPEQWRREHDWDAVADRLLRLHVLGEPA